MSDWVFGYGSLVVDFLEDPSIGDDQRCWTVLRDHRRAWNVAMDNAAPGPGAKHYVDPSTGERPPIAVTFLNIYQSPGGMTNGVAVRVSGDSIADLDSRERNYDRIDVSGLVELPGAGRVWTYTAKPEALVRYDQARLRGTARLSRQYHDYCVDAFRRAGSESLRTFHSSTDEPSVPMVSLTLVR